MGIRRKNTKDWVEYLGLETYCCTFVRGVDERASLLRMHIPPETLQLLHYYQDVVAESLRDPEAKCVVSTRLGDWTLLVERNSAEGLENSVALSRGTEVITAHLGAGADRSFRYLRDGIVLTAFEDGNLGHLSGWGAQPDLLAPFIERVGPSRFRNFAEDGMSADLELACLVANVQPRPAHFLGPLLCAGPSPKDQNGQRVTSTNRSRNLP